ncbi:MAG: hypothetical protein GY700_02125, partial [Propionibacteriaceae bacterium]|nr:hypothetical protein [Propionibacteriaceae bacterium]
THSDYRWLTYGATASSVVNPDESALGYGESLIAPYYVGSNWVGEWVRGWRVYRALDHFTLPFVGNEGAINTNPTVMEECATFLKSGDVPQDTVGSGIPRKTRGGGPRTAPQGQVLVEVSAPMGGTQSAAVNFDSNGVVRGTFVVEGLGALYAVNDSSGTPILLSNLTTTAIADGLVMVDFELNPAPLGLVSVELTAGVTEAAELNGNLEFDNSRSLVARVSPMTIATGQSVQLLASIEDSAGVVMTGTLQAFQANVRQPDGSDV